MIEASGLVLALTTEANADRAQKLAEALLQRHLVACVSIHPVRSFYRWEGSLQASHEVQLLMKTSAQHVAALRSAVSELHGYDTPEDEEYYEEMKAERRRQRDEQAVDDYEQERTGA